MTTGAAERSDRPFSPLRFFGIWLALGAQSFGGGAATLALIRRAAVDQHHWATETEFVRDWALVQMAPGINLLGLVVLLGNRVGGAPAIALALTGLLLPSSLITALLTAVYATFAHHPLVTAALRGIVPATVGIGLVTAWQMARPLLRESRTEGAPSLAAGILILIGAALLYLRWERLSIVAILCGGGAAFALVRWIRHVRTPPVSQRLLSDTDEEPA